MELNDNKAGMAGLDKDKINAIIAEASKGSKFAAHQEKVQQRTKERIENQARIVQSLKSSDLENASNQVDAVADQLEAERDLSRTVVHVDMDAFYAAVEMRDSPQLRSVPLGVGGSAMLSTSNYVARRFGVRAAMPGFIALKLCPQLTIVPCDFDKYRAVSKEVEKVLQEYDPEMRMAGLDEAYLDITSYLHSAMRKSSPDGSTMRKSSPDGSTMRKSSPDGLGSSDLSNACSSTGDNWTAVELGRGRYWQQTAYDGDCLCKLPRVSDIPELQAKIALCKTLGEREGTCVVPEACPLDSEVRNPLVTGDTQVEKYHSQTTAKMPAKSNGEKQQGLQIILPERDSEPERKVNDGAYGGPSQQHLQTTELVVPEVRCPCQLKRREVICGLCGKRLLIVEDVVSFEPSLAGIVAEMRFRVRMQTGLTCSAGVAANGVLAKICSDQRKPNGQFILGASRDVILEFIGGLPIRKVPGIGKATEDLLKALDIVTCADLFEQRALLSLLFKPASFGFLLRSSLGLGTPFGGFGESEEQGRKSISNERTFSPVSDPEELKKMCGTLCEDLYEDIVKKGLKGKNVTVKLKTAEFDVRTRSMTLPSPVLSLQELVSAASKILSKELGGGVAFRLMGVRLASFVDAEAPYRKQRSLANFAAPLPSKSCDTTTSHETGAAEEPHLAGQATLDRVSLTSGGSTSIDSDITRHGRRWTSEMNVVSTDSRKQTKAVISSTTPLRRGTKRPLPESFAKAKKQPVYKAASTAAFGDYTTQSVMEQVCPVCNKVTLPTAEKMAVHVDECLTRVAIKESLQEFRDLPSTSNTSKTKDNGYRRGSPLSQFLSKSNRE